MMCICIYIYYIYIYIMIIYLHGVMNYKYIDTDKITSFMDKISQWIS